VEVYSLFFQVYNYWEPTHFLLYGSGMQTWEYSPEFGLRSYLYVGLHALIGILLQGPMRFLAPYHYRILVFYSIRVFLGFFHAFSASSLVSAVNRRFGQSIAYLSAILIAFSPGLFQASTSYLPQSFSMYSVTLAFAAWIGGRRPFPIIFWMGVSGLIGWPFVAILALGIAPHLIYRHGLMSCIRAALATAVICLLPGFMVDFYYYRKLILPVANIISYNGFTSHGADIYGTEPWHYFIKNLALNFNFAWAVASLAIPISIIIFLLQQGKKESAASIKAKSALLFLSPPAAFFLIFSLMAHKEERFLYPIYPLICVCAAFTIHILSSILARVRKHFVLVFTVIFMVFSISRISSTIVNYSAPLSVYTHIPPRRARVCLGKVFSRF
jgi:alpha-1,2-mannosyltransferase